MVAYLGELGSLVEVQCAADLSTDVARPVRYQSTLGGSAFAQVGPRTGRSWAVRLPRTSTPSALATWLGFVEGEFGLGPWWFVSDVAAVTNVISPRGSLFESVSSPAGTSANGGRMVFSDGSVAGRTLLVEPNTIVPLPWVEGNESVPVVPGVPVTAAAWVDGTGQPRMRVAVYNTDGSLSRLVSGDTADSSAPTRIAVSFTPTGSEASCLFYLAGVSSMYRIARPSISWTETVQPWSVGAGAPRVHVAEMSLDTTMAAEGRVMEGASLRVQEVG